MTIRPLPSWSTIEVEATVAPAESLTVAPDSLPEISSLKVSSMFFLSLASPLAAGSDLTSLAWAEASAATPKARLRARSEAVMVFMGGPPEQGFYTSGYAGWDPKPSGLRPYS